MYLQEKYFKDTQVKVYYGIVPSKEFYHPIVIEKAQENYQKIVNILEEHLDDMTYIDIYPELNYEDYFQYDIHWKQEELEGVVAKITSAMGKESGLFSDYQRKELFPFYGMEATSKQTEDLAISERNIVETVPASNVKGNNIKESHGETLVYLTNDIIEDSSVYHYESKQTTPVYTLEEFQTKEAYGVFLSGADPLLVIENPRATTDAELVIFRDSFVSSLAPLLIESYATIRLVDLRYISSDYIGEFISFTNQDILFLNSTQVLNNSIMLK